MQDFAAEPLPETRGAYPNGPAAAAILAAGVGSTAYGLVTVAAENLPAVGHALTLSRSAGSLSGETAVLMIAWIVSWAVSHGIWRRRDVAFARVRLVAIALIVLGLVLTFPPVYQAFTPGG